MAEPYFRASIKNLQSLIRQLCGWAYSDNRPLPWRLELTDGEGCAVASATIKQFSSGALEFETASVEEREYSWPVMVVLTDANNRQIQMSVA